MDLNEAVSEKSQAWVAVEEEVYSDSRGTHSCRVTGNWAKPQVGRAQLHFHIPDHNSR